MSVGPSASDLGARDGVSTDLAEIAVAIEYYGFELDPIECEKLNQNYWCPMRISSVINKELIIRLKSILYKKST